ncbi:hypothetical protein GEZ65_05740 [Escherichia albertii]|nr:hypothetical protein [Escherichia albertii]
MQAGQGDGLYPSTKVEVLIKLSPAIVYCIAGLIHFVNFIDLFINKSCVVVFPFSLYHIHTLIHLFIRQLNEKEFIIFGYYCRRNGPQCHWM